MHRHRNGPVSLRRLPYFTHVHPWSDKRAMLLLPHGQSSFGRYWTIDGLMSLHHGSFKTCFLCEPYHCDLSPYSVCKHHMCVVTANQVAHVNCGNCRMLLMYQYGARSVKCAVCNFVTSVGVSIISCSLLCWFLLISPNLIVKGPYRCNVLMYIYIYISDQHIPFPLFILENRERQYI